MFLQTWCTSLPVGWGPSVGDISNRFQGLQALKSVRRARSFCLEVELVLWDLSPLKVDGVCITQHETKMRFQPSTCSLKVSNPQKRVLGISNGSSILQSFPNDLNGQPPQAMRFGARNGQVGHSVLIQKLWHDGEWSPMAHPLINSVPPLLLSSLLSKFKLFKLNYHILSHSLCSYQNFNPSSSCICQVQVCHICSPF